MFLGVIGITTDNEFLHGFVEIERNKTTDEKFGSYNNTYSSPGHLLSIALTIVGLISMGIIIYFIIVVLKCYRYLKDRQLYF